MFLLSVGIPSAERKKGCTECGQEAAALAFAASAIASGTKSIDKRRILAAFDIIYIYIMEGMLIER